MNKLIITFLVAISIVYICNQNEYIKVPNDSIRMRVIANSNSEEDINNKLIVKSMLKETIKDITKGKKTYNEVDNAIKNNTDLIEENIKSTLKNNNINEEYHINYGTNYFPEKTYKGITYKAGNYKSYVVTLGEGKGENYWCVLFPPLCLVDENVSDYDYHFLIKDILSKYN